MADRELREKPDDVVSRVTFTPNSKALVVSSWDEKVRIIDVNGLSLRAKYMHNGPVLDVVCESNSRCFSGGMDRTLKSFDMFSAVETTVGTHNDTIRCVDYAPEINAVVTGSWDTYVKIWDVRQKNQVTAAPQSEKVYTLSLSRTTLVVGTAARKVMIWDLRNMSYPQQKRESSLKYQTRCIKCSPDGQGFVLSSIEGRVSVEYIDHSSDLQKKKYAFKCHRVKEGDIERIYPVNAIDFHPIYGTFATGGADGFVNIWDGQNKKRLSQFQKYPTGITSLGFSPDGNMLAVGVSYLFEDPEPINAPEPSVFIRSISDAEAKPK